MPSFCRHNRLIQNCPICSREQAVELRPVVTSSAPKVSSPRPAGGAGAASGGGSASSGRTRASARGGGLKVRQLARGADDGYHSQIVPGLKSSAEAERLAEELAFAAYRLALLETEPPGLLAEVAADGDIEERTWLAFQIAYISPLDGEPDPFGSIASIRTSWASGELPVLEGVRTGPRSAYEPGRGMVTLEAYRAWAGRAGSQAHAFTGEDSWSAERRFERVFERLALPGLPRDPRYELLVILGRTAVYELHGAALQFGGENETTVAAKRALGIGDTMLLERRAADLAEACGVPLEALDLGLHNWGAGYRARGGISADAEPEPGVAERIRGVLGL